METVYQIFFKVVEIALLSLVQYGIWYALGMAYWSGLAIVLMRWSKAMKWLAAYVGAVLIVGLLMLESLLILLAFVSILNDSEGKDIFGFVGYLVAVAVGVVAIQKSLNKRRERLRELGMNF